jgi:FKBP-type peptidyl-prolyl cis-trans isomerase FkpA
MPRIPALLLLCALSVGAYAADTPAKAPTTAPVSAPASAPASAPTSAAKTAGAAMSEADKAMFAIGEILSVSIKPFELSEKEMRQVQAGFAAGMRGKQTGIDPEVYRPKIQELLTARVAAALDKAKAAGKAYRAKAAATKGTITTPSGIVIHSLVAGTGAPPAAEDEVEVQYEGKLLDGTVFDSSIKRGKPASFKLSGVVPCWTEGLQHMSAGGKATLICPPELAYGDNGRRPVIPGGSTLIFQVELMKITKAPPPTAAPAPPTALPAPAMPPQATAPATPAAPAAPVTPAAPK